MVNLQEFIRDALIAVANGVEEATRKTHSVCTISPVFSNEIRHLDKRYEKTSEYQVQTIEFDVAITVSKDKEVNLGATASGKAESGSWIKVISADVGVEGSGTVQRTTADKNEQVSRIKFSVPILFRGETIERYTHIETTKEQENQKGTS